MWKNQKRLFNDKIKYVMNDITKPFKAGIIKFDA